MSYKEILENPDFNCLPTTYDSGADFGSFVEQKLSAFGDALRLHTEKAGTEETPFKIARRANHRLKIAIHAYLRGDIYETITQFFHAMGQYGNNKKISIEARAQGHTYFRMRRCTAPTIGRNGIFHIPFEKRGDVKTQRFSIPGIPCLYLSGSTYTAWTEMRRPPFHETHVAAFRQTQELKLFDMRLPKPDADPAKALALWPLHFLCSIKTNDDDATFKPEYIAPQLALQWVACQKDVHGVVYNSNHARPTKAVDNWAFENLALPAREIVSKGFCSSLSNKFSITEPSTLQLLDALGAANHGHSKTNYLLEINGRPVECWRTAFGKYDAFLHDQVEEGHTAPVDN